MPRYPDSTRPSEGTVGFYLRIPRAMRARIELGRLSGFHDRPLEAPAVGKYVAALLDASLPDLPAAGDPDQIELPLDPKPSRAPRRSTAAARQRGARHAGGARKRKR